MKLISTIEICLMSTVACLMSTVAYAQTPTEYNLKLAVPEIDLISEGLQTQPFGKVAPLLNKMRAQIVEQQQAAAPKPEEPKKPD